MLLADSQYSSKIKKANTYSDGWSVAELSTVMQQN